LSRGTRLDSRAGREEFHCQFQRRPRCLVSVRRCLQCDRVSSVISHSVVNAGDPRRRTLEARGASQTKGRLREWQTAGIDANRMMCRRRPGLRPDSREMSNDGWSRRQLEEIVHPEVPNCGQTRMHAHAPYHSQAIGTSLIGSAPCCCGFCTVLCVFLLFCFFPYNRRNLQMKMFQNIVKSNEVCIYKWNSEPVKKK